VAELSSVQRSRSIVAVDIAPLRRHRHLASEIASRLHALWKDLPPWSDCQAIEHRLLSSSGCEVFPHTLVALLEDGRFAGAASVKLRELDRHPDKEHWLGEVFVPSDLRNRGLGALLANAAARYAFDHGTEALYLYTPDQQRLYAGLGWVTCAEDIVHEELVTIMVRYRNS
jgi:GNAT superfamily N-acetyltransferase